MYHPPFHHFSMIPYRALIINKKGSILYEKIAGDIEDCSEHIVNLLVSFKSFSGQDPNLIVDLIMGDFNVAVSTCCSCYFITVVPDSVQEDMKQLNRIMSIFFALAYSQYIENFGMSIAESFIRLSDNIYSELDDQLSMFYDPEETKYMCFISEEKILCSKGSIPYSGSEYFDVTTDMMELSDICLYEPFAVFDNRRNVIVLPYLENVQIGFVNVHPADEEQVMIDEMRTRLMSTKYVITQLFLVPDNIEEEEEEKL